MNVLASFTITICALAASALASDSELAIPLVCPEELKEHFSKMTDREKSHELQKLQAQNTSALLMMNFMSEYVNWDEFLYDLPVMVTELGKLMLFSDKRDFTLFKEGVTYKYIQRPESFRATLVQLAHTEWTALHAAHHNMDTIRLNTLSVPGIFRLIFRILNREKNTKNQNLLTSQLNRILRFAHENRKVCEDSIFKINNTINLINELQIATLSAQSDQKDSLKVLMKEKAEFEAKVNSSAKMLEAVNGELNRQLDRVKHLQNEYDDAQRKAKPKIGEIFACALIDIVKFAPTMISNVFGGRMGSSHGGSGGQLPSPQDDQMSGSGNEQVSELNEAISVTNKLDTVLEKSELESKTADIIDECLGKVATFRNKILKDLLTSFLQQVKNAYKAVGGVGDENRTTMKQKLDEISEKLEADVAGALAEAASSGNSLQLNRKLDEIGDTSKDTYGQIMGSRLAKLRAATEMLIAANKQYEGLFNKKLGIMERNSEYIAKLTVIDFTQIDFKAILEVMREGIVALGRHIEQWKRFLEFFKIIENLTLLASERTQLFVNGTLMGINDGALMNVYGNDDIYMDMLYEHSFVTIDIAKALNEMTSTYVRVSNKHVFPRLNGITKLLALEDPVEINAAFKQLAADAQTATEEFKAELKKDYNKQQQRVRERVNEVSCYMRLLEEDPYVKKAIEANDNDVQVPDF
ncbi:hypothetical protein Tcan_08903 [Toxocara canis]|uniref:Uncharacterized protein n=1 Tax=Toxocara canis TaxID=6265 RepID=A0A0B2W335_TOXCA|nr:hypothetical protein Tcan_08903 [Toxocara canis]